MDSYEREVLPIQRARKNAKPITADWTTMAATYTHDQDGQRVDQYAMTVDPQSMERPDFVRSGSRSTRSTLQAGLSADHYHVTEQWGQPIQPYGEWRYPNRPFSVPYGQGGGTQGNFGVGPANVLPAGQDEYYPQAPTYQPMSGGGFQSPFRD